MNILALDTSTKFVCIGLEFNKRFFAYRADFEKRHSETLIPILKRLLLRAKLGLGDIDFFCVGRGPGSFTGLRIGIAMIKGFCFSLKKRLVSIPTLDIIANNISNAESEICVILDAKRNLVYSSFYKKDYRRLRRLSKYLLISADDLLKIISKTNPKDEPLIFTGDGISIYKDFLEKRLKRKVKFSSPEFWYPTPQSLISLAKKKIEEKRFCEPDRILPLYLYPKECQVRR